MPGKGFRTLGRERGSVLIEFALVLPLLLVLTFLVIDYARAFHYKNMLSAAARQGARTFAVTPLDGNGNADTTSVYGAVRNVFNPTDATSGKLTSIVATGPTGSAPNQTVTVTVTADFNFLFPGLMRLMGATLNNPVPLTGSCTMRYERN